MQVSVLFLVGIAFGNLCLFLFGDSFTDSIMGPITIFHHHLGHIFLNIFS